MTCRFAWMCAWVWVLGFAGLWIFRGVYEMDLDAWEVRACAHACLGGGLGYSVLGLLALCVTEKDRASQS